MKNFRKLSALFVLLVALSVPVFAGDLETPPAPAPPPPTAPVTSQPAQGTTEAAPGDLETPPAAVVFQAVLDVVLSVASIV